LQLESIPAIGIVLGLSDLEAVFGLDGSLAGDVLASETLYSAEAM
jgi:hypothetical protein